MPANSPFPKLKTSMVPVIVSTVELSFGLKDEFLIELTDILNQKFETLKILIQKNPFLIITNKSKKFLIQAMVKEVEGKI